MTPDEEAYETDQPPPVPPAAVRRLRLTDFRSYASLDLDLEPRPVALFGANGAGKTNLLEALSFLAPGRGLRSAGADSVVRKIDGQPASSWAVFAELETRDGERRVGVGSVEGGRRQTRIDGEPAPQGELARLVPMIWLTPAQDRLFAGPRADRLRFFDRLVYAADPAHAEAASAYEKIRTRRQRLLDEGRADPSWLDALEQGGLLTGRTLDAIRRKHVDPEVQKEVDANADMPEEALRKIMGAGEKLVRRSKTIVHLDFNRSPSKQRL